MKKPFLSCVVLAWLTLSLDAGNCIAKENEPVSITLDQIIDKKLIHDEIEPGTYFKKLEFGPAAYDLGPYVHRYFISDWAVGRSIDGRRDAGKVLGAKPNNLLVFGFQAERVTSRVTSCVIAVELKKLLEKADGKDFLIKHTADDRFKSQEFITKHFFVFTDLDTPPDTEVFDLGDAYKPLGYSFPAITTLPLGFAKKWGCFLRRQREKIETNFYPLLHHRITSNIHLCSLEEIRPEVIPALFGEASGSVKSYSSRFFNSSNNYQICLCGLRKISKELASAMVSSNRHFWLSAKTEMNEEAETILRNGRHSWGKKGLQQGGPGRVLGQIPGLDANRFTLCVDPELNTFRGHVYPSIGSEVGGIKVWTLQFNERRHKNFSYAVLPGPGRCEHLKCFSRQSIQNFENEKNAVLNQEEQQGENQQPAKGEQPKKKPFDTQFNQ